MVDAEAEAEVEVEAEVEKQRRRKSQDKRQEQIRGERFITGNSPGVHNRQLKNSIVNTEIRKSFPSF